MASEPNGDSSGSPSRRRRSSFTEMFAGSRPSVDVTAANAVNGNGPRTGSLSSALQSRARRMSIASIGLSGSPTHGQPGSAQASAFDSLRNQGFGAGQRRENADGDEDAIEDEDAVPPLNGEGSRPTSPSLQRRLSFGARSQRDARASSGASSNGETFPSSDGVNGSSPPGTRKEGFNWSENLRSRAQRSSISAASGTPTSATFMPLSSARGRSKSVAEQGAATMPEPAPPKAPAPAPKAPDHFQERILKGDFYMD